MAKIKTRYSTVAGATLPVGLTTGELAVNIVQRRMFVGGTGGTVELAGLSANTFTGLQLISAGLCAAGGVTFTSDIRVGSLRIGNGISQFSSNVVVGADAFISNTLGISNTAVGNSALRANTIGTGNVGIGAGALSADSEIVSTGNYNTAVGSGALYFNETGDENVAIGKNALANLVDGGSIVSIGAESGNLRPNGSPLNSATGGIYVGWKATGSTNGQINEIVIGTQAVGMGSNTAVLGATTQSAAYVYGLVHAMRGVCALGATFNGFVAAYSGISVNGSANFGGLSASFVTAPIVRGSCANTEINFASSGDVSITSAKDVSIGDVGANFGSPANGIYITRGIGRINIDSKDINIGSQGSYALNVDNVRVMSNIPFFASSGISAAGGITLASPNLTGTPISTTAATGTNTTQVATTAFVLNNSVAGLNGITGGITLNQGTNIYITATRSGGITIDAIISGSVSSVSGSGNGILVNPTTGAVIVQNTGVHSFNGRTGAVQGVSAMNGMTGAVRFTGGQGITNSSGNGNITPRINYRGGGITFIGSSSNISDIDPIAPLKIYNHEPYLSTGIRNKDYILVQSHPGNTYFEQYTGVSAGAMYLTSITEMYEYFVQYGGNRDYVGGLPAGTSGGNFLYGFTFGGDVNFYRSTYFYYPAFFLGGLCAAGGITFNGTVNGTTASFSRIVTLSGGLSAAGGVTLASPNLIGTPTSTTAAVGTNTTQIATTAFVNSEIVADAVTSFNGRTGSVQGVSAAVAGDGISVSGATGAVTITNAGVTRAVAGTGIAVTANTGTVSISNTGVLSFNGNAGAVTGASLGANTFTGLQVFNAGVCSAGGTFANRIDAGTTTMYLFGGVAKTIFFGTGTADNIILGSGAATSSLQINQRTISLANAQDVTFSTSGADIILEPVADPTIGGSTPKLTVEAIDNGGGFVKVDGGNLYIGRVTEQTPAARTLAGGIVFEGSGSDNLETTLTVQEPTADREISLPNDSGVLALTKGVVTSFNGLTGAVTGASLGANTFTALNTFNAGIKSNIYEPLTGGGGITFGLLSGGGQGNIHFLASEIRVGGTLQQQGITLTTPSGVTLTVRPRHNMIVSPINGEVTITNQGTAMDLGTRPSILIQNDGTGNGQVRIAGGDLRIGTKFTSGSLSDSPCNIVFLNQDGVSTTITTAASGSNKTITLPNTTGTVVVDAAANTFTALQSFTAGISASGGVTFAGNLAINGGTITTTAATVTAFNTGVGFTLNIATDVISNASRFINIATSSPVANGTNTVTLGSGIGRIVLNNSGGITLGQNIFSGASVINVPAASGFANNFNAQNYTFFVGGVCASSGVTFSGTLSGTTATFNRLLSASEGISASGGITFSEMSSGAYRLTESGIKALTGTTYTFIATDNGRVLTHDNASGCTVTIPTGLPVGFSTTVIRLNATGRVGFTAASGVTMNTYNGWTGMAGQHASASVVSYATNIFNLSGTLA